MKNEITEYVDKWLTSQKVNAKDQHLVGELVVCCLSFKTSMPQVQGVMSYT